MKEIKKEWHKWNCKCMFCKITKSAENKIYAVITEASRFHSHRWD
jgi:hypothetical protein